MFFVKMLVVSLAALFSVSAWAGLPMAKRPFASSQEFAERVQSGNGMNATAAEYYTALQEYHPDAMRGLSGVGEYANNLEIVPCPQGVLYRLKSVEKNPRRLGEIAREFKPGEQCFKDRNIGEIVGSASCGNVAVEAHPAPKPVPRVEAPRPTPMAETLSCPNGYYLASQSTCCAYGDRLNPETGQCARHVVYEERRPVLTRRLVRRPVQYERRESNMTGNILSFVAGAVIAHEVWPRHKHHHHQDGGRPVDPPQVPPPGQAFDPPQAGFPPAGGDPYDPPQGAFDPPQ